MSIEFMMERDARERRERKRAREAVAHAHFTLDGRPLCDCSATAYRDRLTAAGSPPCSDTLAKQCGRFAALARQFPGRVALLAVKCPNSPEATP